MCKREREMELMFQSKLCKPEPKVQDQSNKNQWHPWILLLFLTSHFSTISSSPTTKISYADHSNSSVPESTSTGLFLDIYTSFRIPEGDYFNGHNLSFPGHFFFQVDNVYQTQTPGVLKLGGFISFSRGIIHVIPPEKAQPHGPDSFNQIEQANFDMMGFWSESTGKLCMVGNGSQYYGYGGDSLNLSAVLKLNYPNTSDISASLVSGTFESLDATYSSIHFDTISILAYAQKNYNYTLIPEIKKSCSYVDVQGESVGFDSHSSCSYFPNFFLGGFKLEYRSRCSDTNCGPFSRNPGLYPSFMSFDSVHCSDGRLHMLIRFSNASDFAYTSLLGSEMTLVSEGFWDQKKKRLCLMGCRLLNVKDSVLNASVSDCTIGLRIWFPAVFSIRSSSTAVGRIWSNRNQNDSNYFDMVSFRSIQSNWQFLSDVKYKYTKMEDVRKFCVMNNVQNLGKRRYPDGYSVGEIGFDFSLRNAEDESVYSYAVPFSVGKTFYAGSSMDGGSSMAGSSPSPMPTPLVVKMGHSIQNVSYKIGYSFPNASPGMNEPTEISSEGIYNPETGKLCMVGCRHFRSSVVNGKLKIVDSTDCQVLINIQLSPLNPEPGEHINGTIRSTREKFDPLYFEPLEIIAYVMYKDQAVESISRMDMEIAMVLISLTLQCIFISLQLYYVKKRRDLLPSISITMLVILTLGHMIPLVLNFKALVSMNHNNQNVLLWSGGWIEVNEFVVRVLTMVAFLLQYRFLQVAWSARSAEDKKGLWVAEREALQLCLPLYFTGGLIAWFVHLTFHETQQPKPNFGSCYLHHSFWDDLISYADLILVSFLLPQVMLNIFWNSKDKALVPSFYVGTTVVRILPHVNNFYRAYHYVPQIKSSNIYVSPNGDFYSSVWNIIIPCEGVLLTVLIYLPQRFGGSCILPLRFREAAGYEAVPVVSL